MSLIQVIELSSMLVIIAGLPLAIFTFIHENRKEREQSEETLNQGLADAYTDFLRLTLDHPDLKLQSLRATPDLDDDQRERMLTMFAILVSLFERAYLVAYLENPTARQRRRWSSWEDFMREWCRREDFRLALPNLLPGEDPEFAAYMRRLAREAETGARPNPTAETTHAA